MKPYQCIAILFLISCSFNLKEINAQDTITKASEANQEAAPLLLPIFIEKGNLLAFIDKTGKKEFEVPDYMLVLSPNSGYKKMTEVFSEGLCAVKKLTGKRWHYGYIDTTGNIAIDLGENFSDGFHEGLARFEENKKWGFINKEGIRVIDAIYDGAGQFSEGLAAVNEGGKVGFIDQLGNWVIIPYFDKLNAGDFHWAEFNEGLCKISDGKTYNSWFIDRTGAPISKEAYVRAQPFSEGLAAVSNTKFRYGYINKKGELVIDYKFKNPQPFSEGLAVVEQENGFNRFINKKGEFVYVDDNWLDAGNFNNGLGYIVKNGLHFVNKDLEKIISLENINSWITNPYQGIFGVINGMYKDGVLEGNLIYYDSTGQIFWQPFIKDFLFESIKEALEHPYDTIRQLNISVDNDGIPSDVFKFTKLESLKIFASSDLRIPNNISILNDLKNLEIDLSTFSSSRQIYFPTTFGKLNLEHLVIRRAIIKQLPDNFYSIKNLKKIDFFDVKISDQDIDMIKEKMIDVELNIINTISIDLGN